MPAVLVLGWIALSIAVAILAERKGRSFELFLNVSLVLSPLVGLVAAAVTRPVGRAVPVHRRPGYCPACDTPLAPGKRACPACGAARPLARLQLDQEHSAWLWLGAITGGVLLIFGLIALLGVGMDWVSRRSL